VAPQELYGTEPFSASLDPHFDTLTAVCQSSVSMYVVSFDNQRDDNNCTSHRHCCGATSSLYVAACMTVQGQSESVINRWSSHATVARLADLNEVRKVRFGRYEQMVSSPDKMENLGAYLRKMFKHWATFRKTALISLFLPPVCWTF